jgi:DNA-binding response OmpR family regulator
VTDHLTRLLLVEDDISVRTPLQKFLEMRHFQVSTAETADEAIALIGQFRPQAAIVDLRLGRGSGRDVVAKLPPEVPVIIFSGLPTESADLERSRPNTRLIAKPFSLVLIVEAIEAMLLVGAAAGSRHPQAPAR